MVFFDVSAVVSSFLSDLERLFFLECCLPPSRISSSFVDCSLEEEEPPRGTPFSSSDALRDCQLEVLEGRGFRAGAPSDGDGVVSDAAASTPNVADRGRTVGAMMIWFWFGLHEDRVAAVAVGPRVGRLSLKN